MTLRVHRRKTGIDLTRLPGPDYIERCRHIVDDPALRHAAQHPEGLRASNNMSCVLYAQVLTCC